MGKMYNDMRTSINNLVGILFCVLSIESCSKDSLDNGKQDYHLYAELVSTKTTNAGMSTTWKRNDKLNVFHAVAGSTDYVSSGWNRIIYARYRL